MGLSRRDFEKTAQEALDSLPERFRARLDSVALIIREAPTPEQRRRHGAGLLGLYEGVPFPSRDSGYSGVLPDRITLFKRPLERAAADRAGLIRLIQKTVLHEIGHYFGFGDERLREMGY